MAGNAGDFFVRPEIPPTRLSGYERDSTEEDRRSTRQEERRHVWPAQAADASDACGVAVLAMRDFAAVRPAGELPQVRIRAALLPPVFVLRYFGEI